MSDSPSPVGYPLDPSANSNLFQTDSSNDGQTSESASPLRCMLESQSPDHTGDENNRDADDMELFYPQDQGKSNGQPSHQSADNASMTPMSSNGDSGSRDVGLVLTKRCYEGLPFQETVRATLSKFRFDAYTPVDQNAPNLDLSSILLPKAFNGLLQHDPTLLALERGPVYTSMDLSKHSYFRAENQQSAEPPPKSNPHEFKRYLNTTYYDINFLDDAN
eukprot:3339322-Rhodomonas_salina.1